MYPVNKDLYDLFHNGLTHYLSAPNESRLVLAHEVGVRSMELGYKESDFVHTCAMAMKNVRRSDWVHASTFLSACLIPIERKRQQMTCLADTTLTLVLDLNNNGAIHYASHSWNRILLDHSTSPIGADFLQYVHPDDQERFKTHLTALDLMRTTTSLAEYRFRYKTGQWRHFECFSRIVTHEVDGNYVILSARDVTDQVAKTEKLIRNQTQLVNAQRIAKLGSWEWDPKTDSILWSREVSRMFNIDHETSPKTMTEFLPFLEAANAILFATTLNDAVLGQAPIDMEIRSESIGGSSLIVHCVGQTINGLVIGTMQDITERKKAEEKMALYSDQLWNLSLRQNQILDKERDRIAREIHDDLGQMLAVLKMDLFLLNEKTLPLDSRNEIRFIENRVDTIIHSVHRITSELRPAELDNLGLIETIEWLGMSFQERTGIDVVITKQLNDEPNNHIPESGTIFRIIQDALTNLQQSSNVKKLNILIELDVHWFRLLIQYDASIRSGENLHYPDSLTRLALVQRADHLGGHITFDGSIILTIPRTEDSRKMYIPKRGVV